MYLIEEVKEEEYSHLIKKNKISFLPLTQAPGYSKSNIYLKISDNFDVVSILSILLNKKFFQLIKYARINNGPILIKENISTKTLLNNIFNYLKKRGFLLLLFAPNYFIKRNQLRNLGFLIKLPIKPYGTIIIDLNKDIKYIQSSLKQKWRNTLKKGIKKTKISKIENLEEVKHILEQYHLFAKQNNFIPIEKEKCLMWMSEKNQKIKLEIYKADDENNDFIGAIGILYFSYTSFYLFGFSNLSGRKLHANSALLWHSITESKSNKFETFDLGGLNETTPLGIKKFKRSLGGDYILNPGEYLKIL